jgi:predicted RNA-binding protein YlqC (UPF0109 family)
LVSVGREGDEAGLKGLVESFACALVDEPQRVSVEAWTEGGELHLDLSVAGGDRGKVIGRRGRTADALRTLLEAAARRRSVIADLEVVE